MSGTKDLGFSFSTRKSGDVIILRDGSEVTVLRKAAAKRFLERVERGDPQQLMARDTGNYSRGNEGR